MMSKMRTTIKMMRMSTLMETEESPVQAASKMTLRVMMREWTMTRKMLFMRMAE